MNLSVLKTCKPFSVFRQYLVNVQNRHFPWSSTLHCDRSEHVTEMAGERPGGDE